MDADLFRAPRPRQSAQEVHSPGCGQHVRLHREERRARGRHPDPPHELARPRPPEPRPERYRHRYRRGELWALHVHSCDPERVPHRGAQRAHGLPQGAHVRLRVHRPAGCVLRRLSRQPARGRADGARCRPQADGVHDRAAPRGERRGLGVRGLNAAPHEPGLAELLRDVAARRAGGHGGPRGDAGRAGPGGRAELRGAGPVPPRAEGAGGVLAGVQRAVCWRWGRARAVLPGCGGVERREERV